MSPESSSPIFIHSLWRAGSTYLLQVFLRSEAGYYCYQEPLHEMTLFNKDTPERLLELSGEIMRPLRHPELSKPYFQELHDIFPAWQPYIQKSDIYDAYFSPECSGKVSLFFKSLIEHAQGRVVIQECRTSNRIGALKKCFGGTHIYLWRNPWDQWWSYKATDYFDMIQLLLINAEDAPPVIRTLRQALHFKEFHSERLQDEIEFFNASRLSSEDSYCCFYLLWCLAVLEAPKHADFMVNIDQLSMSGDYRKKTLRSLVKSGVSGLDFSDCHMHCTQFTSQDATFFTSLEEKVYGLLLSHDVGLAQIDAIREIRRQYMPEQQKALPENTAGNSILEDAKRAREIVVRKENALHWHAVHQLHLRQQLEEQHRAALNQQIIKTEQQCAELQRTFDEQRECLVQQHVDEQQAFKNLLSQQQEKAKAEAQMRLEQIAAREKEYNEQLISLRSTTELEKKELCNQYLERLAAAHQEHAAHEKELLQTQLAMQARSAEREREVAEQLQALHESHRQAEAAEVEHVQCLLNQIDSEVRAMRNSRWWRMGTFLGWLPKTRFVGLSTLLTAGRHSFLAGDTVEQPSAANNIPLLSIEHTHRDNAVVEEESSKEMDIIDQLLLSTEADFITKAYQLILGRQADPTGIAHYRKWLRTGKSRVEILADLMASREAQLANRPGLDELRTLIRQTGASLKGWRKWLALPRIMNHRMAILERHLVQLTTMQRASSHNQPLGAGTSELLEKIEILVNSLRDATPLHANLSGGHHDEISKIQSSFGKGTNDPSVMETLKDLSSESADEFFNMFAVKLSASKEARLLGRSSGAINEVR